MQCFFTVNKEGAIRFGLGGVLFLYVLQPIFEKICEKLGPKKTRTLAVVFLAVFAADCVYTFAIK